MQNLLGESPTPGERRAQNTADDEAVDVENSLVFASALRQHGVPFALHVPPSGSHGLGLAEGHAEAGAWPEL